MDLGNAVSISFHFNCKKLVCVSRSSISGNALGIIQFDQYLLADSTQIETLKLSQMKFKKTNEHHKGVFLSGGSV